ncbi:MAG: hypothetical protein Q7R93_05450 [bacterium]|nr:hypothetical protein [bacterium]
MKTKTVYSLGHNQGVTLNRKEKYRLKKERKFWRNTLIFCGVIIGVWVFALISTYLFHLIREARRLSTHQAAIALGLFDAPSEIEERHVWVSRHVPVVGRNGDVNVHVMSRTNDLDTWKLRGTGTWLGKYPTSVLTAYHVFEGRQAQYGCRRIGPNEFTGNEQIIPIVSYSIQADDSFSCGIDTNRLDFPMIDVPPSTNIFREFLKKDYPASTWFGKIRLSTYPEKLIQVLVSTEVAPGAFHMLFDWTPVPGESGTSGILQTGNTNAYVVVIRGQIVPKQVFDQLTPENKKLFHWSEGKLYGVGNVVNIDPPKPPPLLPKG